MPLTLRVTRYQNAPPTQDLHAVLDEQGGTIGRSPSNDWVLPDPQRYISSHHAQVVFEEGRYWLVDISTNGVFINHQDTPIGKGNRAELHSGDVLTIGDYEVLINIEEPAAAEEAAFGLGGFGGEPQAGPQPAGEDLFPELESPGYAAPPGGEATFGFGSTPPGGEEEPFPEFGPTPPGGEAQPFPEFGPTPPGGEEEPFPEFGPTPPGGEEEPFPEFGPTPPGGEEEPFPGFGPSPTPGAEEGEPLPGFGPPEGEAGEVDHPLGTGDYFQAPGPASIPEDWLTAGEAPAATPEAMPSAPEETRAVPGAPEGLAEGLAERGAARPPAERPPMPTPGLRPRPPRRGREAAAAGPPTPREQPPPTPAEAAVPFVGEAAPPSVEAGVGLAAFLRGAGVPHLQTPRGASAEQVLDQAGRMFREVVQAMIDVLRARANLKSELRLEVTRVQRDSNNPLKVSVTVEDALNHLLGPPVGGYLAPDEAMEEATADIKIHQMALMAGLRAAVEAIIARFDPTRLEETFGEQASKGLLGGGKKARLWERYSELYRDLARDAEEDIMRVYTEEFARAYEAQAREIEASRPHRPDYGEH